jgi:4a-hydroxytetrahydrobiopterin dehydratase
MLTLENLRNRVCHFTENTKAISAERQAQLAQLLPEWQINDKQGNSQLERQYSFADFRQAVAFTNQLAELAEISGHHPDILLSWGKVKVSWWTHAIKALHENDFIMAAKTDALYQLPDENKK